MRVKLIFAGALALGAASAFAEDPAELKNPIDDVKAEMPIDVKLNDAAKDIEIPVDFVAENADMAAAAAHFGGGHGGGFHGGGHVGGGGFHGGGHVGGGHFGGGHVGGHPGFHGGGHVGGGSHGGGHISNPHHLVLGACPAGGWRGHEHFFNGNRYWLWNWAYGPWIHTPYFTWHLGLNYYILEGLTCTTSNTWVGGTYRGMSYYFSDDSINSAMNTCRSDPNVVMQNAQGYCQVTHCDRF